MRNLALSSFASAVLFGQEWEMKSTTIFAVGLFAIGMWGQVAEKTPHSDHLGALTAAVRIYLDSAEANSFLIPAKLLVRLDARKAKVGDRVTAKLVPFKYGETMMPPWSLLIGHVTQARKRDKANPESRLGFIFTQIRLKDGKLIPFAGKITRVEQYFSPYDWDQVILHSPDLCDYDGSNCELGPPALPDFYGLNTVTQEPDGLGILLISTKHEVKLGWNVQVDLLCPQNPAIAH
jgi:hypothetical protein